MAEVVSTQKIIQEFEIRATSAKKTFDDLQEGFKKVQKVNDNALDAYKGYSKVVLDGLKDQLKIAKEQYAQAVKNGDKDASVHADKMTNIRNEITLVSSLQRTEQRKIAAEQKAADTLKKNTDLYGKNLAQLNQSWLKVTAAVKTYAVALGAAFAAYKAVEKMYDTGKEESKNIDRANTLNQMAGKKGGSAEDYYGQFTASANELISQNQQVDIGIKLIVNNLDKNLIPTLVETARAMSAINGKELADNLNDVTEGVISGNGEFLKTLGIITNVKDAVRKYSEENNINEKSLSAQEKALINQKAILEQVRTRMEQLGVQTGGLSDQYLKTSTNTDEMKSKWASAASYLSSSFLPLLNDFVDILKTMGTWAEIAAKGIDNLLNPPERQMGRLRAQIWDVESELKTLTGTDWYSKLKRNLMGAGQSLLSLGTKSGKDIIADQDERVKELTNKLKGLNKEYDALNAKVNGHGASGDWGNDKPPKIGGRSNDLSLATRQANRSRKQADEKSINDLANPNLTNYDPNQPDNMSWMNKNEDFKKQNDAVIQSNQELKNSLADLDDGYRKLEEAQKNNSKAGIEAANKQIKNAKDTATATAKGLAQQNKDLENHKNRVKLTMQVASKAYDMYTDSIQMMVEGNGDMFELLGIMLEQQIGEALKNQGKQWVLEGTARIIASYGSDASGYGLVALGLAAGAAGAIVSGDANNRMAAAREKQQAEKQSQEASQQVNDANQAKQEQLAEELKNTQAELEKEKEKERLMGMDGPQKTETNITITMTALDIGNNAAKQLVDALNKYGNVTGHKVEYKR